VQQPPGWEQPVEVEAELLRRHAAGAVDPCQQRVQRTPREL
jgi:hypothetical protein